MAGKEERASRHYIDDNGKYNCGLLKIVSFGDMYCGQTQLILAISGDYTTSTRATIGMDVSVASIKCPKAKLQIWDISSLEAYGRILYSAYCRGAIGAIIVFDVTNEKSFENVEKRWLPVIKERVDSFRQVILVGTKCDLNEQKVVSRERALMVADELELKYFEVSGKTGYNVQLAITELTKDIIRMIENEAAESRR